MRGPALIFALLWALLAGPSPSVGQEPEPVVHAVLFYAPTCPHCHQVITELLVPMQEEYGRRLVLLGFDTSQQLAHDLYWGALRHFELPQEDWAVPLLIVADEVMVGALEIPARFPGLVEAGLAGAGTDLPAFPALMSLLDEQDMLDRRFPGRRIALQDPPIAVQPAQEPAPAEDPPLEAQETPFQPVDTVAPTAERPGEPTPEDRAATPETEEAQEAAPTPEDPPLEEQPEPRETEPSHPAEEAPRSREAEALPVEEEGGPATEEQPEPPEERESGEETPAQAARELEAMTMWDRFKLDPVGNSVSVVVLLAMIVSLLLRGYPPRVRGEVWPTWAVVGLVVVGFAVASYLSYIEVTQTEAVCGPVGDCNTVNQSRYATLFGVLPVGVLGLMGYVVIVVLWALASVGPQGSRGPAALGSWGAVLFGTLFSVYLTFLEPFVIGATCAWCLTSAVVMTLLLWALAPLARDTWPGGGSADV